MMIRKVGEGIRRGVLRARVRDRAFTIVSNNCWGAHIYQWLDEPYRTPFVGLFIAPDCYLTLLSQLRWYLKRPLVFRKRSRHDYINALRDAGGLNYPIGCFDEEVEIQFMHYSSAEEATAKWSRRLQRVVPTDDRLYIKFCDRDGCTPAQIATFDGLPFRNKVCFVSRPAPAFSSTVWIPGSDGACVPDGLQLAKASARHFDVAAWINRGGRHQVWDPLRSGRRGVTLGE
jgi:uncharacterized protein (DUF1919 family)